MNLLFIGAVFFDTLIGDPGGKYHPVVLIGNLISFLQNRLLNLKSSKKNQQLAGFLLLILTTGTVYAISWGLVYLTGFLEPTIALILNMMLLSFTISPRTLASAGLQIKKLLANGDIVRARRQVSYIVGRDTQKLDEKEVSRATIETVAENITDGIISPLFFAFIGGVPLAFFYRAVNTLDSMVGYKNDIFLHFGMPSARFDDVCNFIPARITAVLIVLASAFLPSFSSINALKIMWRDAKVHPSPNSGFAEAPAAGAMGIRLGGNNYYFGRASFRKYMGDAKEQLCARHITKTIVLMYTVSVMFAVILTII